MMLRVDSGPEWRVAPVGLDGIDLRAARDQQSCDVERVGVGRMVERALVLIVLDVRGYAKVEQQRDNVRAVAGRGRGHRLGRAKQLGASLELCTCSLAIQPHGRRNERLDC